MRLDLLCLGHNFIVRYFPHSVRHQFKPHNDSPLLDFSIIQQTVRHCRRYAHYRGTVGDTSSSYEEICAYGLQYRHKPNLCGEWRHRHNDASCGRISTPHAQSVWSVWRGQQPATVLRSGVHHADLLIRWLARAAGGMTGCVRHCGVYNFDCGSAGEPSPPVPVRCIDRSGWRKLLKWAAQS